MSDGNTWVAALRGSAQMKGVSEAGVERLAAAGIVETAPKGTLLFREGDRARAVHFLAAGSVEVRRSIGSIEVRVGEIRAPFWLGEAGLLEASNRTFTARVSEDATVVAFPADWLLGLASKSPEVEAALDGVVGARLRGREKSARPATEPSAKGLADLPVFLAILAGRAEAAATPRERLRAIVDGAEAIVRYFRAVLVAHTLRDRRGEPIEEKIASSLERATPRELFALVVEGARHHAQRATGFFMPEMCALFAAEGKGAENEALLGGLLDTVVPATDEEAATAVEGAGPAFMRLLGAVSFLAEYPLFEFTGMEYRRGKFLYRAERWMGTSPPFRPEVVEFVAPLECSRVYATRRNAERLVGLFPWLLRISCSECGAVHLFFATGVEGGLVGYVDALTGHRLRVAEIKEEFDFIAGQFRGKQAMARKPRAPMPAGRPQGERGPAPQPAPAGGAVAGAPAPPQPRRPPRPTPPPPPPATVDELVAQTKSPDPATREQAVTLMGRTTDERAKAILIEALADAFPGVRRAAAEGIGFAKVGDATVPLLPLLKDATPYVRRMAAWALAEVGGAEGGEALVASLQDPTTVQFAERALAKLGGPGQKRGTVTWYDAARGYGFGNVEGKHVFIPAASLEAGFVPKNGDLFSCYVVDDPKGPRARLTKRLEQSAAEAEALTRTGTVKWYDPARGFGFLKTDQGEDVFVHVSGIVNATPPGEAPPAPAGTPGAPAAAPGLLVGQRVKFRMQAGLKGLRANGIEVTSSPPPRAHHPKGHARAAGAPAQAGTPEHGPAAAEAPTAESMAAAEAMMAEGAPPHASSPAPAPVATPAPDPVSATAPEPAPPAVPAEAASDPPSTQAE